MRAFLKKKKSFKHKKKKREEGDERLDDYDEDEDEDDPPLATQLGSFFLLLHSRVLSINQRCTNALRRKAFCLRGVLLPLCAPLPLRLRL